MNVSYRWLQALCGDLDMSPEEVSDHLALRGAPVEEFLDLGSGFQGLVVARVNAVQHHPDADRLSVCRVDAGGQELQVICGAPNVREGGTYPFAPVGSRLPAGQEIRAVEIRGVTSSGMLLSELELGLGSGHEGILELDDSWDPGEALAPAMGMHDWRLDVEVTPNRGDLLSHAGVARELLTSGEAEVALPHVPGGEPLDLRFQTDPDEVFSMGVRVRIDDPDLCLRYLGAVVRGVRVGPSPPWLAARLRAAGARPINNVVDATNYVLLELGQPLHAFDLAKLGESAVVVRRAKDGELLKTLDGESRRLQEGMLAICDASDPVAIAGVMGGADSEVSESSADILLECALFEPKSVRATRTALEMSTDASYRFERGVDPEGMETALRRTLEIIKASAGGDVDPVVIDVCPRPWSGITVPLRPSRVKHVLGVDFSAKELRGLLSPLGFEVVGTEEDALQVSVPGFRSYDTLREVDLIEEVARAHGFDQFPQDLGPFRPGNVPDHPLFELEGELRGLLVGLGFLEAQTQPFVGEGEGEVELSNPVSAQEAFLRRSLVPGLLRRIEHNLARGSRDVRLFELGTVFARGADGDPPPETTRLALALTGDRDPLYWGAAERPIDLWDLKGLIERAAPVAVRGKVRIAEGGPGDQAGTLFNGYLDQAAFILLDREGEVVGAGGEVVGGRLDVPAWAGPVYALEVSLPAEPEPKGVPVFQPLPAFPGVDRDLALVLPTDLRAGDVLERIRSAAGALLADVEIFDLYEGEGIPDGYRSVGFRLWFQSAERTLTDSEVDQAMGAVVGRLREEFGVEPRG